MNSEKNILLTSLSNQGDRKSHRYFYFETNGTTKYCDGLSVAEAGAKYILSEIDIDEIVVLGAGRTYDPGEENREIVLREWSEFTNKDSKDISEYSFFQYRIAQFLDSVDMEGLDVLESIAPERAEELNKIYMEFCSKISDEPGYRPDRVFHILSRRDDLYEELIEMIPNCTDQDILWLKRLIYTKFADTSKLTTRDDNADISVCFIPTSKDNTRNYVPAQNVYQIVNMLNGMDADVVNVYMDMQGLASTEGYTILAVLSMLSNDQHNRIKLKEIITSHYRPSSFASPIDNNEMKRYDINNLVSGMDAFIRYGKVDEVQEYWNSRGIENEYISRLLFAMRRVDEGISLCNIEDLEAGIGLLKDVFRNTLKEELPEVESNIFRILENTIRLDYGKILEGDEVDPIELVKWSMRKKFYQQTLTIIESRLPKSMVDSGMLYYADSAESRQTFMDELNLLYWDYLPKDRWTFDDIPHLFIKYYGRQSCKTGPAVKDRQKAYSEYRVKSLDGEAPGIVKGYSVLNERRDLLENILYAYYNLGNIRNIVNHASADQKRDPGETDYNAPNKNIMMLTEGVQQFVNAYEKARDYIREQNIEQPDTFQIPSAELRDYANAHKLYPNQIREMKNGSDKGSNRRPNNDRKDGQSHSSDNPRPAAAAGDAVKSEAAGEAGKTEGAANAPKAETGAASEASAPVRNNYSNGYRRPYRSNHSESSADVVKTITVNTKDGDGNNTVKILITVEAK